MDSTDLNFFLTVANLNGIGRAANELHTVQSNVTQRIRGLEQQLGVQLFDRSKKGVTLTPTGRKLLPYASQIADLLLAAKQAVCDRGEPEGELRVGSMETTAALRLPPILTAYASAFPGVDVHIETGATQPLVQRVLDRKLEGAFVCGPIDHPELFATPVVDEELVIIAPKDISSKSKLLQFLTDPKHRKGIVYRAGCTYRRRLEEYFGHLGLVGARWMEMGTLEGMVGCVTASVGVALVPFAVVADAERAGRISIHHLPGDSGTATTVFIRRRDAYFGSALREFLECALAQERVQGTTKEAARHKRMRSAA